MLTACRSNFFWSISIEMGLHLSVRTEACQSKRWLWASICVHGRIDLPSENSSRQQIPTSQTDKRLSFLKWFPRRPVKLSIWKIVYVCYLSFFPRGKNKLVRSRFFLLLEPWTKKVLLWTKPNSDVPALLGCKPNTFLPFQVQLLCALDTKCLWRPVSVEFGEPENWRRTMCP